VPHVLDRREVDEGRIEACSKKSCFWSSNPDAPMKPKVSSRTLAHRGNVLVLLAGRRALGTLVYTAGPGGPGLLKGVFVR
jgi:hypothetical protein